jgi:exodeoxyribonuclease-3
MGIVEHDKEGRIITLEYKEFFFVTVYTPNAKRNLSRLDYRMKWEDDFKAYVVSLSKQKGVIICGDLNVAHTEIDLKNPKSNQKNAGFTKEERGKLNDLLAVGFVDTFRYINPDLEDAYTWWSYMNGARGRNVGWRIDYFLVSDNLKDHIEAVRIYNTVLGSDHCPIGLTLAF